MVAEARIIESKSVCIYFPAGESIVKLYVPSGSELSPIPEHVHQLDMRNTTPCLKEGVISKHLTHLAIRTHCNDMVIPETLEHLFVTSSVEPSVLSLPKVKNLYFHASVARPSLLIPIEHYVFYWGKVTIPDCQIEKDKYDLIGFQTDINAFGDTLRVIKRVPKAVTVVPTVVPTVAIIPTPEVTTEAAITPESNVLTSERMTALWAINDAEVESMYKEEALEIVSTITLHMEAAAMAGALGSWRYEYPRDVYHARQHLIKILNRYLPHVTITSKVANKIIFKARRC